jgi:hypothetical protein
VPSYTTAQQSGRPRSCSPARKQQPPHPHPRQRPRRPTVPGPTNAQRFHIRPPHELPWRGDRPAWPKAPDSGSGLAGVRGFKSLSPHHTHVHFLCCLPVRAMGRRASTPDDPFADVHFVGTYIRHRPGQLESSGPVGEEKHIGGVERDAILEFARGHRCRTDCCFWSPDVIVGVGTWLSILAMALADWTLHNPRQAQKNAVASRILDDASLLVD